MAASKPKELIVVGWMERVGLPELGLPDIPAKIDTGARTSALHADRIEPFERDGQPWVRFRVRHARARVGAMVEHPIHDTRDIKNTSGAPETRHVIRTDLLIAGHTWRIDLSLTDRSNMRSALIVGRTALNAHNVAVHTRRTRLKTDPTLAPQRRGKAVQ